MHKSDKILPEIHFNTEVPSFTEDQLISQTCNIFITVI